MAAEQDAVGSRVCRGCSPTGGGRSPGVVVVPGRQVEGVAATQRARWREGMEGREGGCNR